ncbi:hypothetical protein KTQ74_16155 [Pseudomonas chlororaphis]|uniref:hypothetical protein n=1 Tax=Pseudomonas chlororaphis TaxID=587753 RepID=UPI001E62BCA0|nr:hypothetical protein [Pseudomonas chlororaphis]MCB2253440.1 hypothetical protein [Pseudomonas chlororaphis]
MSSNDARALFAGANLNYSVITQKNMQRLRALINQKMKESDLIKGTFRCHQRPIVREGYAEIRCRSHYFDNREAVTFNGDGFIGFAGWADKENIQPVLAGFTDWVKEFAPARL